MINGKRLSLLVAGMFALAAGCSKKTESDGGENKPSPDTIGNRKPSWSSDDEFKRLHVIDQDNLHQIGLAMHNYGSAFQDNWPLAAICDKDGKPLLSWRVALLPYIEQETLYRQFKLDEPWDSEHNKKLIERMPKTYLLPGSGSERNGYTHYRVFVAPLNTPGPKPIFAMPGWTRGPLQNRYRIPTLIDGTSNTILVAESEEAVLWTKPDDLVYDAQRPLPKLGYFWKDSTNVVMGDGAVRGVAKKVSEQTLRNAITADDGQVLGSDW